MRNWRWTDAGLLVPDEAPNARRALWQPGRAPTLALPRGLRSHTAAYTGSLTVVQEPSTSATSGVALAQQPSVRMPRAIAGETVTASIASGTGSLLHAAATTDANGVAAFANLTIIASGNVTLQFSALGWTTVVAAAATSLAVNVALSGTLPSTAEDAITGKTILLDVTGDTLVASGATFDAQRQPLIDALVGNDGGQLKALLTVASIVRTSNTRITVTIPAGSYDIPSAANYSWPIPAGMLSGGVGVTASPGFTITAVAGGFNAPDILNTGFEGGVSDWGTVLVAGGSFNYTPSLVTNKNTGGAAHGGSRFIEMDVGVGGNSLYYWWNTTHDRMYFRYYLWCDDWPDSIQKNMLFRESGGGVILGGFFVEGAALGGGPGQTAYLGYCHQQEDSTNVRLYVLPRNQWICIEGDVWRNGDTSHPSNNDYPSGAFWINGVPITAHISGSLPLGFSWITTGGRTRLNAGKRSSSLKIGSCTPFNVQNSGNTIVGAKMRLEDFAISSAANGRVGP